MAGRNAFERHGVDIDEFTEALAEALRRGGASDAEIAEAVLGARVDEALPDDGPWTVERLL